MATFGGFLAGIRDFLIGAAPPAPPSRPPSPPPPPEEPPEEPPEPEEPEPPEESEVRFRPEDPTRPGLVPDAWIIYFPTPAAIARVIEQHIHSQTMRINVLIDFKLTFEERNDMRKYKRGPAGTGFYRGILVGRRSALNAARTWTDIRDWIADIFFLDRNDIAGVEEVMVSER